MNSFIQRVKECNNPFKQSLMRPNHNQGAGNEQTRSLLDRDQCTQHNNKQIEEMLNLGTPIDTSLRHSWLPSIRYSLAKLSKSTTIVLNEDTGFRFVIIRYKRQMIEVRIHAFILFRLSRVRPCRRHLFACIFVSRNLLV